MATMSRWARGALILAVTTWLGIHVVKQQHPTHRWYDTALYAVMTGALVLVVVTWPPFWRAITGFRRGPKLVHDGTATLWRSAKASRSDNDLQVVYGRVRNERKGGGDRATAHDAEIWIQALDSTGTEIGSAKGNWLDLSKGKPNDLDGIKKVTLRPTREVWGIEIAGKFEWGDDAWVAGEADPPSLKPGRYLIRAAISYGSGKEQLFEWDLANEGAGKPLKVDGVVPKGLPRTVAALGLPMASSSAAPDLYTPRTGPTLNDLVVEEGRMVAAAKGVGPAVEAMPKEEHGETLRDTLLRDGAQVVTPVIETTERVGPLAVSFGSPDEIEKVMSELGLAWREQRTALLTYANFHPSGHVRELVTRTDEAVDKAFGSARWLFQMQKTAEAYNAYQQAQARQDEAKQAARDLMEAIRDY